MNNGDLFVQMSFHTYAILLPRYTHTLHMMSIRRGHQLLLFVP